MSQTPQQATTDPNLHEKLLDTDGQVWVSPCGVTAPFSWVLMGTRFCCALHESVSPALCKFWWLYGGVNGDLLQEGLCHTLVCCTQSSSTCGRPLMTRTSAGDLKHSKAGLAQSLWGLLLHTRFCLSPQSISGGYGI